MTTGTIDHVTSADGARIGFERLGDGPPLVLVHGGTADRTRWAPVVPALAERFSLLVVDRRGRGVSRHEPGPYALEREAEDLVAVVEAAGEGARVLAHSYGGLVALEALRLTDRVARAVVYEPPAHTDEAPVFPPEVAGLMADQLGRGDTDAALETFFTRVVAVPAAAVEAMRATPLWAVRRDVLAQTFEREGAVVAAYRFDPARFAHLATPVRLLLGTATAPGLHASTRAAAAAVPGAELVELPEQGHVAMDTDRDGFLAATVDWLLV